jgi:hypothetical protein
MHGAHAAAIDEWSHAEDEIRIGVHEGISDRVEERKASVGVIPLAIRRIM